ncbi:MAG: HlyC/CorC family transporter [Bacteroidales bacterium]|nr:HlyC/CorC family transporter [Bacteroidales bacterium]
MNEYLIVVIALLFSAFFSGMEIAFVASNKLKFELEKKQKKTFSGILNIFYSNPSQYIATMLVGNNIALVIYGIFTAKLLEPILDPILTDSWLLLLSETLISTLIILILAEFLPKTIFRILPNVFLNIFSVPVVIFYYLLFIIARFSIFLSEVFLKIVSTNQQDQPQVEVFRRVDIDSLFLTDEEKQHINKDEGIDLTLFQNALDFSDIKLRDCMIPRTDLAAIEQSEPVEKLKQMLIETGFSRIVVYKDSIDNIIGYAHSLDIFNNPKSIKNITHSISIAPESMSAEKLLGNLMTQRKSMAVVVDEFGGTAGIVTVEDIIEEIFGEIEDEYDHDSELEIKISDKEYKFSARLEIDYINKKYLLNIPESTEYETLAGYILSEHNDIPTLNEVIELGRFKMVIIDVNTTRIEAVHLFIED